MKLKQLSTQRRRGAVIPLVCMLLVVLIGMLAFAIDIGRLTMTRAELQAAADAAALAGADPLRDGYVSYNSTSDTTIQNTVLTTSESTCVKQAVEYAGYNRNSDKASLKLNESDIEFGYVDENYVYHELDNGAALNGTTYTDSNGKAQYPNTIT